MNNIQKPERFRSFDDFGKSTGDNIPKKILTTKKGHNDDQPVYSSELTPNIGWLFYKDYFNSVDFSYIINPQNKKEIESKNAKIIKDKNAIIVKETTLIPICDKLGIENQSIKIKVVYPGLITGVGITHEAGVEGEFKLGLHFDHTYGMPIIHGSSVKGVLRSIFPNFKEGKDKHADSKLKFLIDLLHDKYSITADKVIIKQIEDEIFEGRQADGSRIDVYHRDHFFDAIIIHADGKGRVVESDALAPHGKNPLKNPIPLPFLKISPGCTIQFRFDLKDSKILPELTKEKKVMLFKEIIATLGIGAKTNVGYGQFEQ